MAIEEWEREIQKALSIAVDNSDTLEIIKNLKQYLLNEKKGEPTHFILSEENIAGLLKKLVAIIIDCDHISTVQAYKNALEFTSMLRNSKDRTIAVKIIIDSLDNIGDKNARINILEKVLQSVWDDTGALCAIARNWEAKDAGQGKKILEKRFRILQKHPCQYHVAHEMACIANELFIIDKEESIRAFEKSIEAAKEIDYYIDSYSSSDNSYKEMQQEKSVIYRNIAVEIGCIPDISIKNELFNFALHASIDPFANDPDGFCHLAFIEILFQIFQFDPEKSLTLFKELRISNNEILCTLLEGLTFLQVNKYFHKLLDYLKGIFEDKLKIFNDDTTFAGMAKVYSKINPDTAIEYAAKIVNPKIKAITVAHIAFKTAMRLEETKISQYFEIPLFIAVNEINNDEERFDTLKGIANIYSQMDVLTSIVFSDMYGILKSDNDLGVFFSEMIRNVKSAPDYLFIKEELANHLCLPGVARTGLIKVAEFEINIENYRDILDELGVIQTS